MQKTCGMILFPAMTQLDLTGPYEILTRVRDLRVLLLAPTPDSIRTEHGLTLAPDAAFADAPKLDVLLVPGGPGVNHTLTDPKFLDFVGAASGTAQWITSVCTGALLLGAAGLLRGYRATTHWCSLEFLSAFGAIPVEDQRVVVDRNRITCTGVTAGIDLALVLVAKIAADAEAQRIQLAIEYDPDPPFDSGRPATALPQVVSVVQKDFEALTNARRTLVARLAR